MDKSVPILLLGHARPEKMQNLINSLRPLEPSKILFAVDGPRKSVRGEDELVARTQGLMEEIDWTASIETRFRKSNLGIRHAIPDAVSWAVSKYGKVIVLEEDVKIGSQFLQFAELMLSRYADEPEVFQVNGYNMTPHEFVSQKLMPYRFSRYTSSYAWATWERAWLNYDDGMTWARKVSINDLRKICGSYSGAIVWKAHFHDAQNENVDTWAYRWIATIWSLNRMCISPNSNLIEYDGFEGGTHTRRKIRWEQLPLSAIELDKGGKLGLQLECDTEADQWIAAQIYRESVYGAVNAIVASAALSIIKRCDRLFIN